MGLDVVDAHEREAPGEGQSLRGAEADEQRADQARSLGHREGVDVLGLLAGGVLIDRFGFALQATLFAGLGLTGVAVAVWRWRDALWDRPARASQ